MLIETLSMTDELVHQPLSHRTHAFAVEWIDHSDDRQRALEKKHELSLELPEMERGQIRHRHLLK